MAFEYDDGNVDIVILGGTNKTTGKKNPTEIVGYYLRKDTIKTKFGTKPLYVLRTKNGDKGIIGSGNLNKIMDTKALGLQTHIIDTGTTQDVGKGNPMKVFKVGQDRSDSLDVSSISELPSTEGSYDYSEDSAEDLNDEVEYARPTAPRTPAAAPSADAMARAQAMLKRNR